MLVALALALWALPAAAATSPILTVRPAPATAMTLGTGVTRLAGGFAYRPVSAPPGPLPLIVVLHGAGGDARDFLRNFEPFAGRNGWLLLAPEAAGPTWRLTPLGGRNADYGPDPVRINAVLAAMFKLAPVDPRRVVLLGFSDGASYALSLGLANPDLFSSIVALSPAFAWLPERFDPKQRIFIAHGRRDEILPPANVRERIIPGLKLAGFEPRVRWFDRGHTIDRKALDEGLSFALDEQR